MKNLIKLLGIAALVAVIGFSMIACDTGGGGGGGSDNPGSQTPGGQTNGNEPDDNNGRPNEPYSQDEHDRASPHYYVSASGSDTGSGAQGSPFLTIAKAMNMASSGDIIHVGSGTYYETVTMKSGVTLRGTGADTIITPTVRITPAWSPYGGGTYVADIGEYVNDINTDFPQLFADGDSMVEARWPNLGGPSMSLIHDQDSNNARAKALSGTSSSAIVGGGIPSNISGARLVIWPGGMPIGWTTAVSIVQSGGGSSVSISPSLGSSTPNDPYTPSEGNPFYITGALSLLDAPGEYYFDPQTNRLYFYPPYNVDLTTCALSLRSNTDIAINAENTSNVNIRSIKVFGGGIKMKNTRNSTLANCRVNYAQHFHVYEGVFFATFLNSMIVSGSNNRVERCEFGPTAGSGIVLEGTGITFTNNIVHDTSYAGFPFNGVTVGTYDHVTTSVVITNNTVTNSSHSHISFFPGVYYPNYAEQREYGRSTIRNNYLEEHCTLNSDGGAIYASTTNGNGTEVYNNYIVCGNKNTFRHENRGLYMDNFCSNFNIHHNVVVGGYTALDMGLWSKNTKFENNTLVGAEIGIQFGSLVTNMPNDASTSSFKDNLFADTKTAYDIQFWDGGRNEGYNGPFVNGTIPVPFEEQYRPQSSGNARGTVDSRYRPTGNTPDIGAIPRNGSMFSYGANWML